MIYRSLAALAAGAMLCAQTPILPLREVRAGQRGIGKSVFQGSRIEDFQVEILGVLDNLGPKQSLILARLSGGSLQHTGVMQGMSGSPVYIGGRLVGAVSSAFPYAKDPVAGIRPIEEMLREPAPQRRLAAIPAPARYGSGGTRMQDIATPLSLAGFTARAVEHFAPQLRSMGLEPVQGASGGGRPGPMGDARLIQPGSMISVQLMRGDLAMGADGTVTHIDNGRVYAFGHRFLAIGATEMPFARAGVLTLLANVNTSFKISTAHEPMGVITSDHSGAVSGFLGRRASMVPVSIRVSGESREAYSMEMVNDRLLSPFLLQMAAFSVLDATERTTGASTVTARGTIEFTGAPPVTIDTIYAAETSTAVLASLSGALPLQYAMQTGFAEFSPKRITLELAAVNGRRELRIDDVRVSRARIRPGESVDVHVLFSAPGGEETRRTVTWRAPEGAAAGAVNFTASEAMIANLVDYQHLILGQPGSVQRVSGFLSALRPNNVAALRVWRADPSYLAGGQVLPDPPPSVAWILKRSPAAQLGSAAAWGTKIAEFDLRLDGVSISGSKSAQVEIKD